MSVSAATLREIAVMPEQAMKVALLFLAEQLEQQERARVLAAERQKRYRDAHPNVTATSQQRHSNADVTPRAGVEDNNLPSSKTEIPNTPLSPQASSKPLDPEGFKELWDVYPKRHGTADRKGAVKAFGPARKRADLETILHGARAYAAEMKAKGKIGTEYVRQLRTWLNADGWSEYQAKPSPTVVSKQVPVVEGTPAWTAWNSRRSYPVTDLRIGNTIKRGWYFPTEYPPNHSMAVRDG